jgi:hypothetical protein
MVALPGTRGGLRSSHGPRGPGSSRLDRELTGPCPLQRQVGHRDRRAEPASASEAALALRPTRISGGARLRLPRGLGWSHRSGDRAPGRRGLAGRVREISRPRDDVGAEAEPDVFVATVRAAAIRGAAPGPRGHRAPRRHHRLAARELLPVAARTPSPNQGGPVCPTLGRSAARPPPESVLDVTPEFPAAASAAATPWLASITGCAQSSSW